MFHSGTIGFSLIGDGMSDIAEQFERENSTYGLVGNLPIELTFLRQSYFKLLDEYCVYQNERLKTH
ncbi:MAG: hypothetical protein ACOCXG_05040 [Nanoarchaeota archaeon]